MFSVLGFDEAFWLMGFRDEAREFGVQCLASRLHGFEFRGFWGSRIRR